MSIENWILKTAGEVGEMTQNEAYKTSKGREVKFSDEAYNELRARAQKGDLSPEQIEAVSQIEYLWDTIKVATARLHDQLEAPEQVEAATKPMPKAPEKVDEVVEEVKEEVPPAMPSGNKPANKLAPTIKEPETTKWKEIRFNKRSGTWQAVVTTRHTRNFETESEAIDFLKKA